jgi:hypothetical protein
MLGLLGLRVSEACNVRIQAGRGQDCAKLEAVQAQRLGLIAVDAREAKVSGRRPAQVVVDLGDAVEAGDRGQAAVDRGRTVAPIVLQVAGEELKMGAGRVEGIDALGGVRDLWARRPPRCSPSGEPFDEWPGSTT